MTTTRVPQANLPTIKTVGSQSLYGTGDIPLGGVAPLDGTLVTASFNFGTVSRLVPISLAGGNLVGTLPPNPTDGQICGVLAQGGVGITNTFKFALSGKKINAGPASFGTRTSDCSQGSIAASLAAIGATLTASSVASWTPNHIVLSSDDNPGEITFTIVAGSGGGTLSFTISTFSLSVFRNGVNQGAVNSITLLAGLNTIRIYRNATPADTLDSFTATNVVVAEPPEWEDEDAYPVQTGGYVAWQYSEATGCWHEVGYRSNNLTITNQYQPLDADLTAIAALTTTVFGRSLLAGVDAAAIRTLIAAASATQGAKADTALQPGGAASAASYALAAGIRRLSGATTYTISDADNGKIIILSSATAVTVTLPSGLAAEFSCTIVVVGTGQATITPSSVTLVNRRTQFKTAGQYAVVNILPNGTDSYILAGDTGD